jgi:pimeloyl-ACP methyl ester carboxylesterase
LGTTNNGKPLAYTANATQQPLPVLLDKFRAQVSQLARQSGHPVDIVGESEGSLLASIYLLTTPNPPVDHVVLLSPLVRPARGSYPAPGATGPGLGAGWVLRGIANATNALTPLHVSADSPFIESLGSHADALSQIFGCPVAGVQQLAVLPLADAVGVPPHTLSAVPHETVTALHGTLLANPDVRYDVARYLLGFGAPGGGHDPAEQLATAASSAWQAPPLRLHTEPPANVGCAKATAALRSWLG